MTKNGKDTGIVNIHGKEYQTVAYRVGKFREAHADFALSTEIVHRDEEIVVMKATISDSAGRVIATGHSEERRSASQINRTSALENAETSAIGRALAAFGFGGTEFATADEVANAIHQQGAPRGSARAATEDAFKALPKDKQNIIVDTATQVRDYLAADKDFDAYGLCQSLDTEGQLAIWSLLNASERRRIKEAKDVELATQG